MLPFYKASWYIVVAFSHYHQFGFQVWNGSKLPCAHNKCPHVTLYPYIVLVFFSACHAILEDHKPLWPYGPSSCLGTGILIVALCKPGTFLIHMDSLPVSCVSAGLQNFVISSCWRTAATGLNLCPSSKWRSLSFSAETAVDSSTVNPMQTSHDENISKMCLYHICYMERFIPVKRLGSALWFLGSSVWCTHLLIYSKLDCTRKTKLLKTNPLDTFLEKVYFFFLVSQTQGTLSIFTYLWTDSVLTSSPKCGYVW